MKQVGSKAVLVTLSEEGMLLCVRGQDPVHVPAYSVRVKDVSGAGDTVAAVLAVMLAAEADFESAVRAANAPRRRWWSARAAPRRSGRRASRPHTAVGDARLRGEDRRGLGRHRDAPRRMARRGPAHRLHQRRVRPAASRPHQGAGAGARRLRPAGGGIEQRRLGEAPQGPGAADPAGARPRRGAGRPRSRRPGDRLSAGHAARADQAREADRAGEGRRTTSPTRWSGANWSRSSAARSCWSIWCRASARRASSRSRARRRSAEPQGT